MDIPGGRVDGLPVARDPLAAMLSVVTAASYVDYLEGHMPLGEFYVLLSFAVLGAMLVGPPAIWS